MSNAVTARVDTSVARPLHVLVPLIKQNLDAAEKAAEKAVAPYHAAVGDLLVEASEHFDLQKELLYWAHRNFGFRETQGRYYLSLGRVREKSVAAGENPPSFKSLKDYRKSHLGENPDPPRVARQSWHEPIRETIERARRDAERISEENLSRAQEREAQRQLALRLIDIGFKVLSKELHPDKGGSRDAMARLNQVRDRLKQHA